jgi:hypothetical protein
VTLTHTVSLIEVIWSAVCLIALYFNLRLLRRAVTLVYYLRVERINGIRAYAAVTTSLLFAWFAFIPCTNLLIGINAMLQESPGGRVTTTTYVVATMFMAEAFFSMMFGWIIYVRYANLTKRIREDEDAKEVAGNDPVGQE